MKLKKQDGFTLLEILLVVAAIAILAGIVIIAINPSKQLGDTRNAQRRSDVNTIMNAIHQYAIDNNGSFPATIDAIEGSSQVIGTDSTGLSTTCTATSTLDTGLDLADLVSPTYIVGMPTDPSTNDAGNTDYYVNKYSNGRIAVGACDPEQSETIEILR